MKNIILFFPKPWPGGSMSGRIPFSLLHLYSYIKTDDFNIKIIDERLVSDMPSLIKGLGNDILCFGISSFTGVQITHGLRIARQLKAAYPQIPIVWGGWHPSGMPEQTLNHPLVDIVVKGQGEETFKELLYGLCGQKNLSEIKGISYKQKGEAVHNPLRELLPVIENLRLSYEVVDVDKYIYQQPWGDRAIGIITSLGCPFSCGFCEVVSLYKQKTFFRKPDFVLDELDYIVDKYKINTITFDDDNFFVSKKHVKDLCEKLLQRKYRIAWDAGAHVSLILKNFNDEDLKLIKESGCKQIYIGAESGSEEVLDLINKKAVVSQTFEFVKKMKDVGIRPFLSTMVCFPGVSTEDIYATMDMIVKCRDIDPSLGYRLFYYTPYPGTPLYRKALEAGIKEPEILEGWEQHTLRKVDAPWIKKSHRKQVKNFYFYYFPYTSRMANGNGNVKNGGAKKFLKKAYGLVFENSMLKRLARWRIESRNFKFPLDAYLVLKGQHIRSLYNRHINKAMDLFYDYKD